DAALLRDSADAFEELEAVQRELGALEQAHEAVDDLLGHWRAYLRVRARDRVDVWRMRAEGLAQAEADVLRAEEAARRLRADATAARAIAAGLASDATTVRERLTGLKESAAWRDQGQLAEVRQQARTARKERDGSEARLATATKRLADAEKVSAERREAHTRALRAS